MCHKKKNYGVTRDFIPVLFREKGIDLTQYYDKSPYIQSKKQRDNTKTPPKTSIAQRLQTDVGWSVGVTTATRLVWLNRFTSW